MRFGSQVREVLTASCGVDFRAARPQTGLDLPETTDARQTLTDNLEKTFGIRVSDQDVAHLHTVRDLLQCVRLRLWEQRVTAREQTAEVPALAGRPGLTPLPPELRESFARRTPLSPLGVPPPAVAPRITRS